MTPDELKARLAARAAETQAAIEAQWCKDREAILEIEESNPDESYAIVQIPYKPGLPVLLACRCPNKAEVKRYRDTTKLRKDGTFGDLPAAAEALAAVTRVYPDAATYAKVVEARPGVAANLGGEALKLATAREDDEGKG